MLTICTKLENNYLSVLQSSVVQSKWYNQIKNIRSMSKYHQSIRYPTEYGIEEIHCYHHTLRIHLPTVFSCNILLNEKHTHIKIQTLPTYAPTHTQYFPGYIKMTQAISFNVLFVACLRHNRNNEKCMIIISLYIYTKVSGESPNS